jgi:tetratricopeptide (TPR) repeat protein
MGRFVAWSWLVLFALLWGCNADSRQLLEQAEARWREGNYEDAVRLNLLLHDRNPSGKYGAQALLNLGNIYYLNLRQLGKAIEMYQKLVAERTGAPEEFTARERLAEIYANEIGDLTQAIYEYEKILAWKDLDNRAEIQMQMANAYFKLGDYDRALRELRRIEEQGIGGHTVDRARLKIGDIYQIRKRYQDALEPFQKVAGSSCIECRRRAVLSLMETYEALYDFDRAIETVRRLDATRENERRIQEEVARLSSKRGQIG